MKFLDTTENFLIIHLYAEAKKDYETDGEKFQIYVKDKKYMEYFEEAVELSIVYLRALYRVYDTLRKGNSFTQPKKRKFLKVVSEADLSCPLEKDILKHAQEALKR